MAYNRSVFPQGGIDQLREFFDVPPAQKVNARRYQELVAKTSLTSSEQTEVNNLVVTLQDYLITPEHINKFSDIVIGLETFFSSQVNGYIDTKQAEMQTYVNTKTSALTATVSDFTAVVNAKETEVINLVASKESDMQTYVNSAKSDVSAFNTLAKNDITTTKTTSIAEMLDKKTYFTNYVNTKEDEVRSLVQDFDSNSARFYTSWSATAGQTAFNIYQGSNLNVPPEANLNIAVENIDLVINGVLQTPYVDYVIVANGFFDTISLTGGAAGLIGSGTEVVAKWYKNVGKLYFHHASSHGAGGSDALIVTETMLDSEVVSKLNRNNVVSSPTEPNINADDWWYKEI